MSGRTRRDWAPGELGLDAANVATLVRKELRDALRNRWFWFYTISFAALAIGLGTVSRIGAGMSGFVGFGKTAASLVNLVTLIVPLMGLTIGASSLVAERERGMMGYMLAQPVTRLEVFAAKLIGLSIALCGTICLGFGASLAVMARHAGPEDAGVFVRLVGLSLLLAVGMLAVGMLVSALVRRSSTGLGSAIFIWLGLAFLGDLGLMGATVLLRLHVQQLFALTVANPAQAFKLATIQCFDSTLDLLGPAGLYGVQTFGHGLEALLIGAIAAWVVAPTLVAAWCFVRRPL